MLILSTLISQAAFVVSMEEEEFLCFRRSAYYRRTLATVEHSPDSSTIETFFDDLELEDEPVTNAILTHWYSVHLYLLYQTCASGAAAEASRQMLATLSTKLTKERDARLREAKKAEDQRTQDCRALGNLQTERRVEERKLVREIDSIRVELNFAETKQELAEKIVEKNRMAFGNVITEERGKRAGVEAAVCAERAKLVQERETWRREREDMQRLMDVERGVNMVLREKLEKVLKTQELKEGLVEASTARLQQDTEMWRARLEPTSLRPSRSESTAITTYERELHSAAVCRPAAGEPPSNEFAGFTSDCLMLDDLQSSAHQGRNTALILLDHSKVTR
jgi:hypothetical protein